MKTLLTYLFIISSITYFTSCTNNYAPIRTESLNGNLKVNISNMEDTLEKSYVNVRLYKTKEHLKDDIHFKRQEICLPDQKFAFFEDIDTGHYYIKAFKIGQKEIYKTLTSSVKPGQTSNVDIVFERNGSIEVFVKIGITTIYCGGAFVFLYKTEEDMYADNYIAMGKTDPIDPRPGTGQGAFFDKVSHGKYWIKATWQQSSNTQRYSGTTSFLCKGGQENVVEVSVTF